ncbi:MAG: hemin receptor [Cyclobacteriaceae bacterium]
MTNKEKEIVQSTFEKVAPIAETAASIFYTKLFELDPELKSLFKGDIKSQGRKLMTMLGAAVKGLDDMESLLPVVQGLGNRHGGYGVQIKDYETVGAALLSTLQTGLGNDWNEEVREAWVSVYSVLSSAMIEAQS